MPGWSDGTEHVKATASLKSYHKVRVLVTVGGNKVTVVKAGLMVVRVIGIGVSDLVVFVVLLIGMSVQVLVVLGRLLQVRVYVRHWVSDVHGWRNEQRRSTRPNRACEVDIAESQGNSDGQDLGEELHC